MDESVRQEIRRRIETEADRSWRMQKNGIALLAFCLALLFAYLLFLAINTSNRTGRRMALRTGGDAIVTETTGGAVTRAGFDRMRQLAIADDTIGLAGLLRAGQAMKIDKGTRVKIIDNSSPAEVRILDGPHEGRSAFVVRDQLRPAPN